MKLIVSYSSTQLDWSFIYIVIDLPMADFKDSNFATAVIAIVDHKLVAAEHNPLVAIAAFIRIPQAVVDCSPQVVVVHIPWVAAVLAAVVDRVLCKLIVEHKRSAELVHNPLVITGAVADHIPDIAQVTIVADHNPQAATRLEDMLIAELEDKLAVRMEDTSITIVKADHTEEVADPKEAIVLGWPVDTIVLQVGITAVVVADPGSALAEFDHKELVAQVAAAVVAKQQQV